MALRTVTYADRVLEVLSVTDERDGETWLQANPFARALEYVNPSDAVLRHVSSKNQRKYIEINAHLHSRVIRARTKFINRAGMFELIMSSRMPRARNFQRWVFSDLLPKLCQNGHYDMRTEAPKTIVDSMNVVRALTTEENVRVRPNGRLHEVTGELLEVREVLLTHPQQQR
ncbi:anti-repressor Ant [Heliothis virescens ascovirus 3f]|uniref:Bro24 n=1 Tax=Heliothis virescens ascovirus 3f TaxID=328614 RepID=A0A171PVS1_9VIRU|nr:anti-repressor Ant [Heliothis virescens ascovirus 3f]AJP09130.1 Bro24 [Heliothis virescens ascovirus 3f]